jgi:3-dehydroquinate synthase
MHMQEKFSYINCSNVETTVYFQEVKDEKIQVNFKNYSKILIITENIILKKYDFYMKSITNDMNFHFIFEVEQSDFHKNNTTKEKIDNTLLEKNFDTNSLIIGFGGGKVTDLAGFVASTFLRGVDLLLIPTTLLSMVDASIGGKTGINNLHYGKNLIGSFYNPK